MKLPDSVPILSLEIRDFRRRNAFPILGTGRRGDRFFVRAPQDAESSRRANIVSEGRRRRRRRHRVIRQRINELQADATETK